MLPKLFLGCGDYKLNRWRVKIMIKTKSTFDYIREIRNNWTINPRTRVQENELKNKKKRRQEEKKVIKEGLSHDYK